MTSDSRHNLLAACMMHVEGYYSVKSLAWRNRNPGNIEDKEGHYRVYPTALIGYNALIWDIQCNVGAKLIDFIAKYAPPNENDSQMYLQTVCTLAGMSPGDIL